MNTTRGVGVKRALLLGLGGIVIGCCATGCAARGPSSLVPVPPAPLAPDALPVVIDTDMAIDDWMAILYLLQHPGVDVRAIAVTGTGEAHCEDGVRNAMGLTALAGRPGIPVACGRETPLLGAHAFPTAWRERVDRLLGLTLPENPNGPAVGSAVDLLARAIDEAEKEVQLITLGPLTNVAELVRARPEIVARIAMITIMGGAVDVPGNVGPSCDIDNDVAEWNLYVDPHAARIVLESGAPITLVPLDATNDVPITPRFARRLSRDRNNAVAEFAHQAMCRGEEMVHSGHYFFWDQFTAALVTDPDLARYESMRIEMIEREGPECGATRRNKSGALVRVAISGDAARFETLYLAVLNGRLSP